MGNMTELATTDGAAVASTRARILLYSDDRSVREQVQFAVGPKTHDRHVRWTEVATHAAVLGELDAHDFDLVILDGEAAKSGGMGICRQMKHEIFNCPPVLLLVGRPDDAWLATWSEADAAVSHPLDAFEVKAAVDEFFATADAN